MVAKSPLEEEEEGGDDAEQEIVLMLSLNKTVIFVLVMKPKETCSCQLSTG